MTMSNLGTLVASEIVSNQDNIEELIIAHYLGVGTRYYLFCNA